VPSQSNTTKDTFTSGSLRADQRIVNHAAPTYAPRVVKFDRLVYSAIVGGCLLFASDAGAATWGSFDNTRMAYAAGTLDGSVHSQLRMVIATNGDTLAAATPTLTAEYLATVDVFYTGMLSDGTGPTAGSLGTLSLDEQGALQDWITAGGTLVITPDSNGFDGPFAFVYDSWLSDYGFSDFAFVFSFGTGTPIIVHPITEGVTAISTDGTVSYTSTADDQVLALASDGSTPFITVLEPDTGFDVGGRILVLADHNTLTDNYIGELDNLVLAENIVAWAADMGGEGTTGGEETTGGDSTSTGDDGGTTSGSSGGVGDSSSTSGGADSTGGGGEGTTALPEGEGSSGTTAEVGTSGSSGGVEADGGGDDGCGCRSGEPGGGAAGVMMFVLLGLRRRRSVSAVAGR